LDLLDALARDLGTAQLGDHDAALQHDHARAQALQLGAVRRAHDGGRSLRRRQVDEPVDVGLRADIDALRRLVEHEHPWRAAEPAGHHDLLLVAARQLADDRLRARRTHVELVDPHLGVVLLGALAQPPARPERSQVADREVLAEGVGAEQGVVGAVGRHGTQPGVDRRPRVERRDGRPVDDDLTDAQPTARQQAGQLVAAGSGEPGDADHLAATHVEVDRRQLGAADATR
jgi:hypothetical protein